MRNFLKYKIDFYSRDMDYNDPEVYKMLGEGKTDAVFQLESGGFKKFMKELKPDVIVGDSVAFWGKLIAKKLNIPFISSTTTFAFNQYSARVMKQEKIGLLQIIKSIPKINKSLNRLREKGYEVKSVLDIIGNDNDTSTIVYTSKYFQPYS